MQDPRMALVEKKYHKAEGSIPEFRPGDTVKVHVKVVEGNRSRIQVFEGVVIGRQHGGLRENFIVRKISNGVGVERIFPVHCPSIDKIEVVRKGRVRRAKLYYLRKLSGKAQRAQGLRLNHRILRKKPSPSFAEGLSSYARAAMPFLEFSARDLRHKMRGESAPARPSIAAVA